MKPIIAITAGDINGVGYEIILKSLVNPHICEICRPIVYGNAKVARQYMQTLDEEYRNIQWNIIQDPKQAKDGRLNMITCYGDDTPVQMGVSTTWRVHHRSRTSFAQEFATCMSRLEEWIGARHRDRAYQQG